MEKFLLFRDYNKNMISYEHIGARFIERYKRFLVKMELESGEIIEAHCPNPGKMEGLLTPGNKCSLQRIHSSLSYQWQMVFTDNTWIGVNTMVPNKIVKQMLTENTMHNLKKYSTIKSEPRIMNVNSRADFQLDNHTIIEVKNVHWKRDNNLAYFPDCVTERGKKHMELMLQMAQHHVFPNLVTIFVVQRNDCDGISIASDVDSNFSYAFHQACQGGMKAWGISLSISPGTIKYNKHIPLVW